MRDPFDQLRQDHERVLLQLAFQREKASKCASIFASNSRDGVYSHGLNRFPVFVDLVKEGLVVPTAEPTLVDSPGSLEIWDGHRGPGMYNASLCMDRAITLAKKNGVGCVTIRNNNHWMRGGTYGLQA